MSVVDTASSEGVERPLSPPPAPSLDRGPNKSASCSRVRVVNVATGEVVGLPCKSWRCDRCAVSNRRAFRKRLRLGLSHHGTQAPKLLTLTSTPAEPPYRSRAALTRRFAEVRRRLVRAFPGCQVEYAGAVELTRRGAVHFHVVLRGVPYLPQPVWSRLVASAGFGSVVDIRRVRSGALGDYLSKDLGGYLTKAAVGQAWPPHFRRIRFSRDWAPSWVPRPRGAAQDGAVRVWQLLRVESYHRDVSARIGRARGGQGPPQAVGAADLDPWPPASHLHAG